MKGYYTGEGYMGYISDGYMLFSSEGEYEEYWETILPCGLQEAGLGGIIGPV